MKNYFNIWCWGKDNTIMSFEQEVANSLSEAIDAYHEEEGDGTTYLYTLEVDLVAGTAKRINILHNVIAHEKDAYPYADIERRAQLQANCEGVDGVLTGVTAAAAE